MYTIVELGWEDNLGGIHTHLKLYSQGTNPNSALTCHPRASHAGARHQCVCRLKDVKLADSFDRTGCLWPLNMARCLSLRAMRHHRHSGQIPDF